MLQILESLYDFAPLKGLPIADIVIILLLLLARSNRITYNYTCVPSIMAMGFLPPCSSPFKSPRSARGRTRPPPIVLELPVMEPTMIMRAFLTLDISGIKSEHKRK